MDHLTTPKLITQLSLRSDLTDRELLLLDRLSQAVDEIDRLDDALRQAEDALDDLSHLVPPV